MNRGVEISAEVADLPRSVIIDQVRNGVATRMAVLYLLLGQGVDKVLGPSRGPPARARGGVRADGTGPPLVLKGGRVIDQTGERTADVVVDDDGRIAGVGADLAADRTARRRRLRVSPGFVDLHSHLREPGQEEAETVETGAGPPPSAATRASSPCRTPTPAIDHAGIVREVLELGDAPPCDVRTSGAITVGRAGGAARPDRRDGRARRAALHRRRRRRRGRPPHAAGDGVRASLLGVVLAQHCEDPVLSAGRAHARGGVVGPPRHPGQPAEAEELMVLRDLALARLTGARVHFQHLSTAARWRWSRQAKADGLRRHRRGDHPPLHAHPRGVRRLRPGVQGEPTAAHGRRRRGGAAGLADGAIDCIATDHAPHTQEDKEAPFDQAPPGMLGLETALGPRAHRARPQDRPGARPALVAAAASWASTTSTAADRARQPRQPHRDRPDRHLDGRPGALASRSRNTPYAGRTLTGKVRHTLLFGEPVVVDGEAQR